MTEKEQQDMQRRRLRRRRNELVMKCFISLLLLVIVFLIAVLTKEVLIPQFSEKNAQTKDAVEQIKKEASAANGISDDGNEAGKTGDGSTDGGGGSETGSSGDTAQDSSEGNLTASSSGDGSSGGDAVSDGSTVAADGTEAEMIAYADRLAAMYDYDGAISYLKEADTYTTSQAMQNAVAGYEATKATCTAYSVDQVTHIFFHTLIWDTAKAFDGDLDEGGYNQVMTTMSEFTAIMESMYAKGYVMVSLHDMCTVNEDGTVSQGEILLPPGKKPFVLSQDDVSYYHYMDGDGFAQKLIVDENGKVKNTYVEDDGSISVGDYDLVPWIDSFVEQHPDFSYHGHKGIIALTGYEGVLGYRTDEVYRTREEGRVTQYQQKFFDENPDFDEAAWQNEVDSAKVVAEAMKAEGWEFASHTWGHINPLDKGIDGVKTDTERWLNNVSSIVGDTDVIIFAFGADIGDWEPYTDENEYFVYLKEQGFHIYCNVDSAQYWVQFGSDYMRQGRRNLDGYRMYYNPDLLSDLFDVDSVWDSSRPTPVPEM